MEQLEGVNDVLAKSGKKRNKPTSTSVAKVDWKGYVNPTLTPAQKAGYAAWRNDPDIYAKTLETTLRDGFKLSINYFPRESAFQASLYCTNPDYPEAGFCMSVFGGDIETATHKLIYIHVAVLKGDWSSIMKRSLVDNSW